MPRQRSLQVTEGLGERLRRLRLQKGLTQADLAAPDYTHAYVSTIESGRRIPSDKAVEHFAAKLGVDPEEILTGRSRAMAQQLEIELQRARGDLSGGKLDDARFRLRAVAKKAGEMADRRLEARAEELLALSDERRGKPEVALKGYDRAVSLLSSFAPTASAFAVAGKVRTLQSTGEAHHAIYVGEHYLDQLARERLASPSAKLRVMSPMVLAYLSGGFHGKATELAEECAALTPRVNDAEILATAHVNVASVESALGHYDDAARSLQKAEQLFEALELQHESGIVHLARGMVESRRGKFRNARQHLREAIKLLGDTGNHVQQSNAAMELARVDRLEGRCQESAERLRDALDQLPPDEQPRLRAWGHRELASALAASDPKDAEKQFVVAAELYDQIDEPIEMARTLMWMAEHRLDQGDTPGALDAFRQATRAMESAADL